MTYSSYNILQKRKKNGVKCIDKAKKNIKVEVERLKAKFVTKGYKQQ